MVTRRHLFRKGLIDFLVFSHFRNVTIDSLQSITRPGMPAVDSCFGIGSEGRRYVRLSMRLSRASRDMPERHENMTILLRPH